VPLAPNPKRAMLITMNDRWFHCPMENTRVSKTSKARVEKDTRKMAVKSIAGIVTSSGFIHPTCINRKEWPQRHQDTNNKFLLLIKLRVWWRKYFIRKILRKHDGI
jgi:hypothetical protein